MSYFILFLGPTDFYWFLFVITTIKLKVKFDLFELLLATLKGTVQRLW